MESVDLIIIGAGPSGLAALRTYLQVHPSVSVVVLDSAATVGGVWAKDRLYTGLKTNNIRGSYEFSDFPMDETFAIREKEHIPGPVVHAYMQRFVEHFQLAQYIRLKTTVHVVSHQPDGTWLLSVSDTDGDHEIRCKKLIVCTGMTYKPYMPAIKGREAFNAPIFHVSELAKYQDATLGVGKRVTVFGGTKSAWDVVYAAVTEGSQVDWVIRDNGHGPAWMALPYATDTPTKIWLEKLMTTRLFTWFSPCIWGAADGHSWIRAFLNRTWLGRKIIHAFWAFLTMNTATTNNYDAHPETRKLKPWIQPFWVATGFSILNYPTDFFKIVTSGKVRIHIARIDHLSPQTVHLRTRRDEAGNQLATDSVTTIPSDALICCTGWDARPSIEFRPASLAQTLGYPNEPDSLPEKLVMHANEEILRRFPYLRNAPQDPDSLVPLGQDAPAAAQHPFRLVRYIVPPALAAERSIAFMGVVMAVNTTMIAQAQALWVASYFGGALNLTPERCPDEVRASLNEEVQPHADVDLLWDTALYSQFGVFRCPGGFGKRNPDIVFDSVPYVDLLLKDLGLSVTRKFRLWDWMVPYSMADYKCLVAEWMAANKHKLEH